jgi:cephalosporin hydroxylase
MRKFLKKRYSYLDISLLSLVLAAVLVYFWHRSSTYASYFDEGCQASARSYFDQFCVDDSQASAAMRSAFADIAARRNVKMPVEKQRELGRLFHELDIWQNLWYLGIRIEKNPCDLWMMQQLLYEVKPDYLVEAGTFRGGSALYFAHILEGLGLKDSKVLTIDIRNLCQEAAKQPLWKRRVEFIEGSSTDPRVAETIRKRTQGKKVLVVLDSVHERGHVLKELGFYAPLVPPGSYVVVEDTNSDGLSLFSNGGGPLAAVRDFLATAEGKHFSQDFSREALVLTFNPGGWLKRVEGK